MVTSDVQLNENILYDDVRAIRIGLKLINTSTISYATTHFKVTTSTTYSSNATIQSTCTSSATIKPTYTSNVSNTTHTTLTISTSTDIVTLSFTLLIFTSNSDSNLDDLDL